MKLLYIKIILVLLSPYAAAHIYFTKGDAYIYSEVTKTSCEEIFKSKKLILKSLDRKTKTINIVGDTENMRKGLIEAYNRYRNIHNYVAELKIKSISPDGTITAKLIHERDSLKCFIYNKNYPLMKRLIGFKYNESWIDNNQGLRGKRFLSADWMYIENFLFSKEIEGLKANRTTNGVELDAKKICIILISDDHYTRFLQRENEEGITVTKITDDSVDVYTLKKEFGKCYFEKAKSIKASTEFGKADESDIFGN